MSLKDKYVKKFNMQYLEGEGGYFVELYRASDQKLEIHEGKHAVMKAAVTSDEKKADAVRCRDLYTTIYYLMEKTNAPHVNKSDHVHFFHDGGAVKYYWLDMECKQLHHAVLGSDVGNGQHLQLMVPGGTLKWAVVLDDAINDRCAFISECVMPGFEFEDRVVYSKEQLQSMFPEFWDEIKKGFP